MNSNHTKRDIRDLRGSPNVGYSIEKLSTLLLSNPPSPPSNKLVAQPCCNLHFGATTQPHYILSLKLSTQGTKLQLQPTSKLLQKYIIYASTQATNL